MHNLMKKCFPTRISYSDNLFLKLICRSMNTHIVFTTHPTAKATAKTTSAYTTTNASSVLGRCNVLISHDERLIKSLATAYVLCSVTVSAICRVGILSVASAIMDVNVISYIWFIVDIFSL